jgi:protein involved in ribonucleotide reduction
MKTLNIVYYSHLGNTERFVKNHLVPAMVGPVVLHQIVSSGPHQPATTEPMYSPSDNDFLLVFPCYGRNNTETHEVEKWFRFRCAILSRKVEAQGLGRIVGG